MSRAEMVVRVTKLEQGQKTIISKLNKMDNETEIMQNLSQDVAVISSELRRLSESSTKNFDRIDQASKNQGERVGALEKSVQQIPNNKADIVEIKDDISKINETLNKIQLEPAEKWKTIVKYILIALVTAAVTHFLGIGGYY